ncbi:RHS repeat domain-containing protein [Marinoscillum sp. 108]|uniref:RHS repeat domain-containing protein n=1 Tax=Marinoscillum sp. 108 TaxID=2653151 RepID=UPI0012F3FFB4|nr:RHS repeat domain-containing protein [Marinoscillum sp. 108]VXD14808.1 hypothetical protein MARINOS108_12133 [Marinoscillum sp. 108]
MKRNRPYLAVQNNYFFVCLGAFIIGVFMSSGLLAQQYNLPTVPTPTAYSFVRFNDISISHHSGTPNIEVPLYTIDDGDVKIPISLRYAGGGIRVNEEASWVGLGWNLNVGGVIVRSVKGQIDETCTIGTIPGSYDPDALFTEPYTENQAWVGKTSTELYNEQGFNPYDSYCSSEYQNLLYLGYFEPDVFTFQFMGYSGSFIYDESAQDFVILNSNEPLKIEMISGSYGYYDIGAGYKITTSEGVVYEFDRREIKYPVDDFSRIVSESFYLTKILYTDGSYAKFDYETLGNAVSNFQSLDQYRGYTVGLGSSNPEWRNKSSYDSYQPVYLTEIETNNFIADFSNRSSRIDIYGEEKLDRFTITDKVTNLVRGFNFQYSNSLATNFGVKFGSSWHANFNENHIKYRLILNQVWQDGLSPYEFIYNTKKLPYKTSYAVDHWGFYNEVNNSYFFPNLSAIVNSEFRYNEDPSLQDPFNDNPPIGMKFRGFANRGSNEEAMKAEILEKIIYPTKGHAEYEWGSHEFTNHSIPDSDYQGTEVLGNFGVKDSNGADGDDVTARNNFPAGGNKAQITITFSVGQVDCGAGQNYTLARNTHIDVLDNAHIQLRSGTYGTTLEKTWTIPDEVFYGGYDDFPWTYTIQEEISLNPSVATYFLSPNLPSLTSQQITDNCGKSKNYGFHVRATLTLLDDKGEFLASSSNPSRGGGLRINGIGIYNPADPTPRIQRTYTYNEGKLNLPLSYFTHEFNNHLTYTNGQINSMPSAEWWFNTKSNANFYAGSQPLVSYGYVEENQLPSNGSIIYEFKNVDPKFGPNNNLHPFHASYESGLIERKTFRNAAGEDVKIISYTYDDLLSDGAYGAMGIFEYQALSGQQPNIEVRRWYTYKFFFDHWVNTKTVVIDLNPTNTFTNTIINKHNSLGQVIRTVSFGTDSLVDKQVSIFKYPNELKGGSSFYQTMFDRNFHPVVEQENYHNQTLSLKVKTNFESESFTQNGENYFGYYPTNRLTYPTGGAEVSTTTINYDHGKMIELTGPDQVLNVFLWDGNQLVARGINTTFNEFWDAYFIDCGYGDYSCLKSQQPNARFSLYEYEPINGPTKITDENGLYTEYVYDTFGRLLRIKDHDGNVLEEYTYNYKN